MRPRARLLMMKVSSRPAPHNYTCSLKWTVVLKMLMCLHCLIWLVNHFLTFTILINRVKLWEILALLPCADAVPVFSLGAVSLRMDTVGLLSSAESSTVSLQGVSLSTMKTLTESMESLYPASQASNPMLKLTKMAFTYHITTHTLQVNTSKIVLLLWAFEIFVIRNLCFQ